MNQDDKKKEGAPSSDTTAALFVSARKKQLEQQEAERISKEKEERRIAAEAEVRRLEAEVEERRRRAEEESKRVAESAAQQQLWAEEESRRIAEQARVWQTEAAQNPDAILGTQTKKNPNQMTTANSISGGETNPSSGGFTNGFKNKKILAIIGGLVVLLTAGIVFVFVLGNDSNKKKDQNEIVITSSEENIEDDMTYDISGYYYWEGDQDLGYLYFYMDGDLEIAESDGTLYEGEWWRIDDMIYTETEGEVIPLHIIDNYTLVTDDGVSLYFLDDDDMTYDISGYYYLEGDQDSGYLYFYMDGDLEIAESDGTLYEGEWWRIDDTIYAETEGDVVSLYIIDNYTLVTDDGVSFIQ